MDNYIIIPARLNSGRLPRKALFPINGIPMIVRVWEQACKVRGARVVVATDSSEIELTAKDAGANVILTGEHRNGMERCAEAARTLNIPPDSTVLCLQGDMPYVSPDLCSILLTQVHFMVRCEPTILTAAVRMGGSPSTDPDLVKVVMNNHQQALYFSRLPIPCGAVGGWHKHLGLYCMKNHLLQHYSKLSITDLEQQEGLEQLRLLYRGHSIRVYITSEDCLSVNNKFDCEKIDPSLISWPYESGAVTGHVI